MPLLPELLWVVSAIYKLPLDADNVPVSLFVVSCLVALKGLQDLRDEISVAVVSCGVVHGVWCVGCGASLPHELSIDQAVDGVIPRMGEFTVCSPTRLPR